MPDTEENAVASELPEPHDKTGNSTAFVIGLGLAILAGAFLRLYLLPGQILLDDEWHSMGYVAQFNSLAEVLTTFSLNLATSIPQNAYNYVLLKTIGWNEMWLRLPSILAGLCSLIVFPILIRKIFGRRITLIFAGLIAISPFLVFYSRMARPYSLTTVVGFISIWALFMWATKRELRYAITYVLTACLAICLHLFAAIAMIMPLLFVLLAAWRERFGKAQRINAVAYPNIGAMLIAAAVLIALTALFAISGLTSSAASDVVALDHLTLATFVGLTSLWSGTANIAVIILFFLLLAFGLFVVTRKRPLLAAFFAITLPIYFVVFVIMRPFSIHEPIVVTRYLTTLFPFASLFVAAGLDGILSRLGSSKFLERLPFRGLALSAVACLFVLGCFAAGPLPHIYTAPNNFTNHSVFQDSYEPRTWEQSYVTGRRERFFSVTQQDIPDFYGQIAGQPNVDIIEFPMPIVNVFNLYYYYQHFHRKRVLIGYLPKVDLSKSNFFIWVDGVLSTAPDASKLRFRNLVNLDKPESIRSSGAKYVILHTDLLGGEWKQNFEYPRQDYSALINYLREKLVSAFGLPIHWDKNLIVFEVTKPPPTP